jgi:hypothetical protein
MASNDHYIGDEFSVYSSKFLGIGALADVGVYRLVYTVHTPFKIQHPNFEIISILQPRGLARSFVRSCPRCCESKLAYD